VPVYEGKHIEQFLFGLQPIRWWLSLELAQQKYGRRPIESPVLVFRETAANTNQRTGIALVLPAYSAAAHTLTGMEVAKVDSARAAAVINSFVFDFGLRMRTAGTHISMTYLRPMPVPPPERVAGLPTLPTIDGWTSPCNYVTDIRELWEPLWRSNRAVAEAYGLNAADFAHILASFPSFARKRPDFFAYLQQQCAAWAASG
jgi:hypothetical protein